MRSSGFLTWLVLRLQRVKTPTHGSKEWLEFIAKRLGESLLGIELSDYQNATPKVMPQVQIAFVIPYTVRDLPQHLTWVTRLKGFGGVYMSRRGNQWGSTVGYIVFNFYDNRYPKAQDVIAVAEALGLTVADPRLNHTQNTSRLSPLLFSS